jgi:hypothetical protein
VEHNFVFKIPISLHPVSYTRDLQLSNELLVPTIVEEGGPGVGGLIGSHRRLRGWRSASWMARVNWQFSQFTRFKLAHVNWFDPPCSSRTSQSVQSVLQSVLNRFVRLGGLGLVPLASNTPGLNVFHAFPGVFRHHNRRKTPPETACILAYWERVFTNVQARLRVARMRAGERVKLRSVSYLKIPCVVLGSRNESRIGTLAIDSIQNP